MTKLMLAELRSQPLSEKRLLDIGGGVGVVSGELARSGIGGVTFVEASPAYLEVARGELEARYGSRPIQFVLGDFTGMTEAVPDADVTTLDRVVCCYPDADALLRGAAARTRQLLALTYPRDRWYVRIMIAFENLWRRFRGSGFRAFVHPARRMCATLEAAGLVRTARHEKLVWVMDLYRRT